MNARLSKHRSNRDHYDSDDVMLPLTTPREKGAFTQCSPKGLKRKSDLDSGGWFVRKGNTHVATTLNLPRFPIFSTRRIQQYSRHFLKSKRENNAAYTITYAFKNMNVRNAVMKVRVEPKHSTMTLLVALSFCAGLLVYMCTPCLMFACVYLLFCLETPKVVRDTTNTSHEKCD